MMIMSFIYSLLFRCLVHPSFKIQALLRAVLRDEMIAWHKKNSDTSQQGGATTSEGAAAQPQVSSLDLLLLTSSNTFLTD